MDLACQICEKMPATVHLTDISPEGERCEQHLCDQCAQTQGITPKPPSQVPLSQMLTALVGGSKITARQIADLSCPQCKLTFVEFRNTGLLGCPSDYDAFEKALAPLIERAHEQSTHHIGKVPRRIDAPRAVENDLIRLRRELDQALDDERYEHAAKLRDNIHTLETS